MQLELKEEAQTEILATNTTNADLISGENVANSIGDIGKSQVKPETVNMSNIDHTFSGNSSIYDVNDVGDIPKEESSTGGFCKKEI